MATSDTVAFRPDVEEIIAEAFERCGIDPQTQTGYKAVSARRSLNLLFSEWANRGINYWAVKQQTLTLSGSRIHGALRLAMRLFTSRLGMVSGELGWVVSLIGILRELKTRAPSHWGLVVALTAPR